MNISKLEVDCNCGFTSGPCVCKGNQIAANRLQTRITELESMLTEREGWVLVPKGVIERLRIWKDKLPKGTVFSHGRMKEGEWEKTVLELSSFTVGELDEIIDILIAAATKQEEQIERKEGCYRLIYNKETKKIDKVRSRDNHVIESFDPPPQEDSTF